MRVLQVSAIFQSTQEFRATNLQESSETLLVDGLRESGVTVETRGHALRNDWDDFDVVHIHHLANSCVSLFLPQRAKIVFTRHATMAVPFHHRVVLRRTHARSDAVVVLSDVEQAHVGRTVPEDRIHLIRNGLNGANFPRSLRVAPVGGEPWKFVYVGQLIELKRVELAIRLISDLVRDGHNVQLEIVSHRDTLRKNLENLAVELGVSQRISFLGPRTRGDLGTILTGSHILVLPSRTEALPTVVTEAVFSGLPVAAFQVGGISEQLPTAVVLPQIHDYPGFRNLVRTQIGDYTAVAGAFYFHSQDARKKFSTDGMVQRHSNLYERIIEARN